MDPLGKVTYYKYDFQPIDPACSKYVSIYPPNSSAASAAIENMSHNLQNLQELFLFLIEKSQTKLYKQYRYEIVRHRGKITFLQRYYLRKLMKLQLRLQSVYEVIFTESASMVSQLIYFMHDCKNANLAAQCDEASLRYMLSDKINNDDTISSLKAQMKNIDDKALLLNKLLSSETTDIKQLAKDNDSKVDLTKEYAPYSSFDDGIRTMYKVLMSSRDITSLKETTTPSMINPQSLTDSINTFATEYDLLTYSEVYMLRSAVHRLFFDEVFFLTDGRFLQGACDEAFQKKCEEISSLTPRKLNIHSRIIPEEYADMSFRSIVQDSVVLSEAVRVLNDIQFYNSPYEILDCVFRSLKKIEEYIDSHNQQASKSFLSFDDFFSIFWPLITVEYPPNITAVSEFISCLSSLQLSSPFDFAKMVYCSAIDYCKGYDQSEP